MDTKCSSSCSQNLAIFFLHPVAGEFDPIRPTLFAVRSLYCDSPIYACTVQVSPVSLGFPNKPLLHFPSPRSATRFFDAFSPVLIPVRTNASLPFSVDIIHECLQLIWAFVAVRSWCRRRCRRWNIAVLCLALSVWIAGVKFNHVWYWSRNTADYVCIGYWSKQIVIACAAASGDQGAEIGVGNLYSFKSSL